ncbi:hypothetical protein K3177_15090 [Qipengyuania sp. GH25]|uniref:Uncharacterized protein n=1 Tax=Qipengyuania pacifica TaxID=2860199 RepID=A0ABS7JKB8_9SPHN|nr:MucR family transcriptional regulator [Qipengyuania aerophila]MBX7489832.1 hypothetical protein [Qipengyuania aerophila]
MNSLASARTICRFSSMKIKRYLITNQHMNPKNTANVGVPVVYPMVAPADAETRRELAVTIGLERKPGRSRGRRKVTSS